MVGRGVGDGYNNTKHFHDLSPVRCPETNLGKYFCQLFLELFLLRLGAVKRWFISVGKKFSEMEAFRHLQPRKIIIRFYRKINMNSKWSTDRYKSFFAPRVLRSLCICRVSIITTATTLLLCIFGKQQFTFQVFPAHKSIKRHNLVPQEKVFYI